MVLPVLGCLTATMGKSGMFTLIVVSALITCTGMVNNVKIFLYVMVGGSLMLHTIVCARMDSSGMVRDVLILVVWVGRSGMEPSAYVLLIEISMEPSAWNASMDKSGMQLVKCVNVQQAMNGQVSAAKEPILALEIVFMMRSYSTVSVLKDSIGTGEVVPFNLSVLVEESGTWILRIVIVRLGVNGTQKNV